MPGKHSFSSFSQGHTDMGSHAWSRSNKKLRRLPHVFSKVLELPFNSDADVSVKDKHDCLKFIAKSSCTAPGCSIHVVEVHPGITKVVIRKRDNLSQRFVDELELDVWRFRLPPTSQPELTTVVFGGGELIVTVPKNGRVEREGNDNLVTIQ